MNIGRGLHKDGLDIDTNILVRGLKDAMAGGKTLMTDEQAQSTIMELQGQLRRRWTRNGKGGSDQQERRRSFSGGQ